jgi:curved DNA-binding protein CbpA
MERREALEILGLPSTAEEAQIREAYRDLAKVWHPDRFRGDQRLCAKAEENLKRINAAYRTLQRSSARGTDESTTKPSNRPADGDRPGRSTFTTNREPLGASSGTQRAPRRKRRAHAARRSPAGRKFLAAITMAGSVGLLLIAWNSPRGIPQGMMSLVAVIWAVALIGLTLVYRNKPR